jgi:hypothetical protein
MNVVVSAILAGTYMKDDKRVSINKELNSLETTCDKLTSEAENASLRHGCTNLSRNI